MELYLFIALAIVYLSSSFMLSKKNFKRVWFVAFFLAFLTAAFSVSFIRIGKEELMVNVTDMLSLYFTYAAVIVMVLLGILNFWMFRKSIWKTLFGNDEDSESEE